MENIFNNKVGRFNVLMAVYNATDAVYDQSVNVQTLAANAGMSGMAFRKIYQYLVEEGLLKPVEQPGGFYAYITHKGIKAIEEVFIDQYQPTYYFPAYRDMR